MTTDRLTRTVREQVAQGRLLPLGGPGDALWITERAAAGALRRACAALPGVRLGDIGLMLGGGTSEGVPAAAPVGALPHVPLMIAADFEAVVGEPLPRVADRLRDTLWAAATDGLGLTVQAVDLRVTGLLEDDPGPSAALDAQEADAEPETGPAIVRGIAEAVEAAARAVPGVLRLTRRLAGFGGGLRIHDTEPPDAPARHVQLQVATAPGHRPLTVARHTAAAVARAASAGAPGPVGTAVVVTDVH